LATRLLLLVCAAAIAGGALPLPLRAQERGTPAPAASADIPKLVGDLASEDLATRLAADEALRSPALRLADLESAITKDAALAHTPEQRQRILDIGWDHFRSEPRAAMGIRSNWTSGRGVTIDGVTPGFPASNLLRAGDRVESADGVKLDQFNTLRMVILSHDPGDEMALRLLRDGAVLSLTVPLGSFASLPERVPDEYSMKQAWLDYRAKRALATPRADAPEPLPSGVPLAVWARADEQAPEEDPVPPVLQAGAGDDRTGLVVGGQARGGIAPPVADAAAIYRSRRMTPDAQGLQAQRIQNEQARLAIQVLFEQRRTLEADVQASIRQLADPSIPEARKRGLREDMVQKQAAIQSLDLQIRQNQLLLNRR
jgi:hypothetical protein